MSKTSLQCFFSLHLCPCLVVSFYKLRWKWETFLFSFQALSCSFFVGKSTTLIKSWIVHKYTWPHPAPNYNYSQFGKTRGWCTQETLDVQPRPSSLDPFWTKVPHFATLFKTRHFISWPWLIFFSHREWGNF